ncbi:8-amino-7-oxononanoate synthase [Cupriavidus necator]|uniref:8-amino-7-oxononanoate synthase n=1 Tax=Cupriavidus necator TaxID=106590 RepID=UPI003ECCE10F
MMSEIYLPVQLRPRAAIGKGKHELPNPRSVLKHAWVVVRDCQYIADSMPDFLSFPKESSVDYDPAYRVELKIWLKGQGVERGPNGPDIDKQIVEFRHKLQSMFTLSDFESHAMPYTILSATLDHDNGVMIYATLAADQPETVAAPAVVAPAPTPDPTIIATATALHATPIAMPAEAAASANLPAVTPKTHRYLPLPDPITERSGPMSREHDGHPRPVTLQRTTRALTGDVGLWMLIKLNSVTLGWDNYIEQMDRLFFPKSFAKSVDVGRDVGTNAPLYKKAVELSHRRFLPFTDTDAYRALKVATEAFVVTWGAVVPPASELQTMVDLLIADPAVRDLANERLGLNLTEPDIKALALKYFGEENNIPPAIPYLQRVALAMGGTDAAGMIENMVDDEITLAGEKRDMCGEGCLWLQFWNRNVSAKLAQPPLVELIWSYWMEELQLVQTMNAISRRFQNVASGPNDPLGALEMDPLRPLNNMIWGWVQDEQHRLPIERRAAEYLHEYGFQLIGKAVPRMQAADTRSKFLAAFHTLLNLCVPFFRQADDTTVVPDGFPLLNALREVHLILSEGAHNQFRDLPTTSRVEMMMQQWMLARPEFREFLPRRSMIAYPEPWMHSVESMRKLQGWGDTNPYQFWQLATMGEQIVASIRWSDWNSIHDPANAANWAAFFRPEIQAYIHSYRAVTGVDVGAEPVDVQVPGMHLLRRLHEYKGKRVA